MLFRKRTIETVHKKMPLRDAINRTKVLVIDDEDTFPVKLMQNEGYNITKWDHVESLSRLEAGEFDIIILDIYDVAKDVSMEDGLGVLEHLKKYNPGQIIVAYSGKSFDLSKNRFWKIADDILAKPSDLITCKEVIDRLIEDKFTVLHYWAALKNIAFNGGISPKDMEKVERRLVAAVKKKEQPSSGELFEGVLKASEVVLKLASVVISLIFRITASS